MLYNMPAKPDGTRTLKYFTLMQVSVEARCDMRTVRRVFEGAPVTNVSRQRAYEALVRRKLIQPREEGA